MLTNVAKHLHGTVCHIWSFTAYYVLCNIINIHILCLPSPPPNLLLNNANDYGDGAWYLHTQTHTCNHTSWPSRNVQNSPLVYTPWLWVRCDLYCRGLPSSWWCSHHSSQTSLPCLVSGGFVDYKQKFTFAWKNFLTGHAQWPLTQGFKSLLILSLSCTCIT